MIQRFRLSIADSCALTISSVGIFAKQRALTSMCPASVGSISATSPVKILTTPPGTSEVANTSPKVMAQSGFVELAMSIAVFPPTIMGKS